MVGSIRGHKSGPKVTWQQALAAFWEEVDNYPESEGRLYARIAGDFEYWLEMLTPVLPPEMTLVWVVTTHGGYSGTPEERKFEINVNKFNGWTLRAGTDTEHSLGWTRLYQYWNSDPDDGIVLTLEQLPLVMDLLTGDATWT